MKTYSTRYNATRAAKTFGLTNEQTEIVEVEGGFTFKTPEPTDPVAAPEDDADLRPRFLQAGEVTEDDVPAFLRKSRPLSIVAMADAVEAGEKVNLPEVEPAPAKTKRERAPKVASEGNTKAELRPDGLRVGSGLATLVDTVCRPEGATNTELCEAVGWAQCLPAMRKACDKAGVTVRTEKERGQPTRYFGSRP